MNLKRRPLSRSAALVLAAIIVMTVLSLAACGGQPAPAAVQAPAASEPIKLCWWGGVPEANGPKQSVEAWNKGQPRYPG